MAGIKDVARSASVSVSTVSHVVNGTRHVTPETTARVRQAIEELGYHPNSVARSLRRGKTHTLGLLVPDNSNPFFAEVARVVEDEGFIEGYSVILCNSSGSEAREKIYVDVLLSKQVDGLIFIASSTRLTGLRRVLNAKVPVVVVDREIPSSSVTHILVDQWRGGYIAGEYLVKLGHHQIAVITGPDATTSSAQRLQGFNHSLSNRGISLDEHRVMAGDFRFAGGQEAIRELLARGLKFTAVFAANDLMAMGAINTLHGVGLRIPEDVSVMGFDDIPYAATALPPITTIAQPIEELGRLSVHALIEQIRLPDHPPQGTVLMPHLVVRESCAAVGPVDGQA
ncbi:MAG TPA: substrate-binding domain-containing protein [Aggregatilineaceae bacterium]|nr:substrate-binding domain-containing protein [Aggregatilineaceae bacterium]